MGAFELRGQCDLTFTTTARNSEVVIGVATAAFPGHPLIYMAILVELPVLLLMAQGVVRLRPVLWARQFSQKDTTLNGS